MEETIGDPADPERKANESNTKLELELEQQTIAHTVFDSNKPETKPANRTQVHIAGYETHYKLGEGGMGAVYLATDKKLGRQVAIKVISNVAIRSQQAIKRFTNEIQSVAALSHTNIAQLFFAGEQNDLPFFVMEYVAGRPLDERLKKQPLEPTYAARLLAKLAEAIEHCHQRGIVHRDLKPSNILMDQNDEPKIADFGLAKSTESDMGTTRTGEVIGTPAFMAPEQAAGNLELIGPATDVYGLGAILYHSITGRMPFSAPTTATTISKVITDEPIAPRKLQPGIPRDLETICLKCLSKDQNRRYESAESLALDLKRFVNGETIIARPANLLERAMKWTRRRPALAALMALVCVGIPAAFGGMIYHTSTLQAALQREKEALKTVDLELQKSRRLADGASELTTWLLEQHQAQVSQLSGSVSVVNSLQSQVRKYLDAAIADMPNESKFVRRLANTYVKLATTLGGEHAASIGNQDDAYSLLEMAMSVFDRALEISPDDQIAKNLKTRGLLALSDLQMARGDFAASQTSFQTATELFEANHADTSSDRRLLRLFLMQAKINQLVAQQNIDEALQQLDEFESVIEGGSEDALEALEVEHQRLWKLQTQTRLLIAKGAYEQAMDISAEAKQIAKSSYEAQPDNSIALNRYANVLDTRADLQKFIGKHAAAIDILQNVAQLREKNFENNPDDTMAKFNLANTWSSISAAFMQTQNPAQQLDYASRAFQLYSELAETAPNNRGYQMAKSQSFRDVGTAESVSGQFDSAIQSYQAAIRTVEAISDSNKQLDTVALQAELHMQLGMIYFQQLATNESIARGETDDIQTEEEFISAVKHFDSSLSLYENATRLGELNHQQKFLQNQATKARSMILNMVQQLESVDSP